MKKYQYLFMPATNKGKWLGVLDSFACIGLLLMVLLGGMFSFTHAATSNVIVSDNFNRTVTSGWGSASTGGWWTVVGSPWAWSVTPGAGSMTVGANSEERAYLSSFNVQDVNIVEQMALPRCSGKSNCDSFIVGRYSPAYTLTTIGWVWCKEVAKLTSIFVRNVAMVPTWAAISILAYLPRTKQWSCCTLCSRE